jgi:hypothetical protein
MSTLGKIATSAAALAMAMASIAEPVLARGGGHIGGAFMSGGGGGGGVSHGGGGFSRPSGLGGGFSHGGSFVHTPMSGFSHPNVLVSRPGISEQFHSQIAPGVGNFAHHKDGWRQSWHHHPGKWRYAHGHGYWWYGGPVWWGAATDECPYPVNACMQCAPIYDPSGNVTGWQLENVC